MLVWFVLIGGLTYVVIPEISEIPRMGEALRDAQPAWAILAVLIAATGFFAAAASLAACSPMPLPFLRTTRVQLANAFAGTATPANVGSLALNVRYLAKSGMTTALATGTVALQSIVQVLTHLVLVTILALVAGRSIDHHMPTWAKWALLAAGVAVVATGVLLLVVPRFRHAVRTYARDDVLPAFRQLGGLAKDPRRLGLAVLGAMGTTLTSAATLWVCVLALGGGSDPIAAAFSTMVGQTLASAAPTPGGVGVVEAALTGGLVGFGIPSTIALPAVLLYRLITCWIPVLLGWITLRRLQREDVV
ncbi:lysylphosphatidylglycerol synthase transmembrane domain-containing protein [Oerskovia turbata]|uniref:lysylphosphatidylglycerol synthase transmembrane domain-containing protein n=1 Tax=Oerskovia turbata TaxID=1713 RepID=UPI00068D45C3|nr:lysylphosphatidylglycerol synthase transmembrane domain-containing protein [Oerskovia turbata]